MCNLVLKATQKPKMDITTFANPINFVYNFGFSIKRFPPKLWTLSNLMKNINLSNYIVASILVLNFKLTFMCSIENNVKPIHVSLKELWKKKSFRSKTFNLDFKFSQFSLSIQKIHGILCCEIWSWLVTTHTKFIESPCVNSIVK
jgi:hypothetical protein